MNNILIVESENDKFFVKALLGHISLHNVEVSDGTICATIDFECMEGLNATKLTNALEAVKNRINKSETDSRIGILIDQDNNTDADRLSLVNDAIKNVFGVEALLDKTGQLKEAKIENTINVQIATYFNNINGTGELETILKAVKNQASPYADCLENWQNCLKGHEAINNGNGLKQKDFDKFWVQVYIRYDTCTKDEQKQAGRKCNSEAAMSKAIWNFNDDCLKYLIAFLNLFSDL